MLPIPLTRFVGREAELREAAALLGANRLLTLTDPGGAGKTRLALQLAANLDDQFPDAAQETALANARENLADFAAVWAEGAKLSVEEAIAYAARGRGERKRPTTGWASLTPSELEVVRLVGRHLSNPEIAERLFISRATVKTHLVHIFSKLGVDSRSALAAEALERGR